MTVAKPTIAAVLLQSFILLLGNEKYCNVTFELFCFVELPDTTTPRGSAQLQTHIKNLIGILHPHCFIRTYEIYPGV